MLVSATASDTVYLAVNSVRGKYPTYRLIRRCYSDFSGMLLNLYSGHSACNFALIQSGSCSSFDDDDDDDDDDYRAEKTEVLSEEHQDLERHVDLIHRISTTMLKKLQACLSTQGITTDAERRMVN